MKGAGQLILSLDTQLAEWVESTNMETKKLYFCYNWFGRTSEYFHRM